MSSDGFSMNSFEVGEITDLGHPDPTTRNVAPPANIGWEKQDFHGTTASNVTESFSSIIAIMSINLASECRLLI